MPEIAGTTLDDVTKLASQYISENEDYSLIERIGAGGSAVVYKVSTPSGLRALKVYDPELFNETNAATELRRLDLQKKLLGEHNENIVSIFTIESKHGTCFIEMEYVPWEELRKCLDKIPDEQIPLLISQLINAIKFLDGHNLVHRDIKPENILISDDYKSLKLIDFGVIREQSNGEDSADGTDHDKRRPFIATAQYSSPEYLFRLIEPSSQLWQALTIYQVGAVTHDLLAKRPLFDDAVQKVNKYSVAFSVLNHKPVIPLSDDKTLKKLAIAATHALSKNMDTRLLKVKLDDFIEVQDSAFKSLMRKLERVVAHSDEASREKQRIESHARLTYINSLKAELKKRLISQLNGHATIEDLKASTPSNAAAIRVILRQGMPRIDIHTELAFEAESNSLLGTILVSAFIGPVAEPLSSGKSPSIACEIDLNEQCKQTTYEATCEEVIKFINKSLELHETSESTCIAGLDLTQI